MTDVQEQKKLTENPFPQRRKQDYSAEQKVSQGIFLPEAIDDQPFPTRIVVNDVVNERINTVTGQVYMGLNFGWNS